MIYLEGNIEIVAVLCLESRGVNVIIRIFLWQNTAAAAAVDKYWLAPIAISAVVIAIAIAVTNARLSHHCFIQNNDDIENGIPRWSAVNKSCTFQVADAATTITTHLWNLFISVAVAVVVAIVVEKFEVCDRGELKT